MLDIITSLHPVFLILLGLFVISVLVQLIFYWLVFYKVAFYKPKNDFIRKDIPISVVICARNECQNLRKNLPLILEQDYPNFEVVVINHNSDDDTIFLLQDLEKNYTNIKYLNLTQDLNFFKGKKFPLSLGIKEAKNEYLIFTDADCRPISKDWIRKIAANFTENTSIVLGYGGYEEKKGFLNKLVRFDTVNIAMNYLGLALAGLPYMGIGRNLAYTKTLFYHNKGFTSHYHIPSGDDDLFINKAANKKNIRIEIAENSFTLSEPKTRYIDWVDQKVRHNKTSKYYKKKHKFILSLQYITQYLFWICSILLIAFNIFPILVGSLFVLRLGSQLFITRKVMHKLNEKKLIYWVPLLEIIFLFQNFIFVLLGKTTKNVKWK